MPIRHSAILVFSHVSVYRRQANILKQRAIAIHQILAFQQQELPGACKFDHTTPRLLANQQLNAKPSLKHANRPADSRLPDAQSICSSLKMSLFGNRDVTPQQTQI